MEWRFRVGRREREKSRGKSVGKIFEMDTRNELRDTRIFAKEKSVKE